MSAKSFYSILGGVGIGGIAIVIGNINNQSYAGRCWFMGGILLFFFTVIVALIVYGLRRKEANVEDYVENMPLVSLFMDNERGLFRVKYLDKGRVVPKDLNQKTTRISVDEEKAKGEIAVLEVNSHVERYKYHFLFIKWDEKTAITKTYKLLVSKPIDIVLNYYARRWDDCRPGPAKDVGKFY